MPPLSHKAPDRVRDDGGRFRPPSIRPTAALSGRRGDRTIPPLSTRWGFAPLRGVFSLSTRWGPTPLRGVPAGVAEECFSLSTRWGLAPFRGAFSLSTRWSPGSRSGVSRPALPGGVFRYRPDGVLRRSGVSRPALPERVFRYRPGEVLRRFGGPGRRRRGMLFVIDPMGSCAAGVAGSGRTCPVCFPDPDAAAFGAGYAPFGSRRRPFYVIVMFSISGVYRRILRRIARGFRKKICNGLQAGVKGAKGWAIPSARRSGRNAAAGGAGRNRKSAGGFRRSGQGRNRRRPPRRRRPAPWRRSRPSARR